MNEHVMAQSDQKGRTTVIVFLSHASFSYEIVAFLKDELERRVPGTSIFSSSDPTDLPPGAKWSAEIQRALQESDILLLLLTGRSLGRPWVWFEAGTLWFSKKPLIPLCLGQVRKNALPPPLSERQAFNADDASDFGLLLQTLAESAGRSVVVDDVDAIVDRLRKLDANVAARGAGTFAGWLGVEWNNRFLAYDGPLEGLELIEDEVFQQAMADALSEGGYQPRLGNPDRLWHSVEKGYRLVYLTDRQAWRRKIAQGDLVLLARPVH